MGDRTREDQRVVASIYLAAVHLCFVVIVAMLVLGVGMRALWMMGPAVVYLLLYAITAREVQ